MNFTQITRNLIGEKKWAFSNLSNKFLAVGIFKIFQKINQCVINFQAALMQIMPSF